MELFALPARLPRAVHGAVFGDLPSSLARELDDPEVASAVRVLLDAGWRPGQLAGRVGGLPAATDAAAAVRDLLRRLADEPCPDSRWAAERAARLSLVRADEAAEQPASPEVREACLTRIRTELGTPRPRPRPTPAAPVRPACASCGGPGELFVTRVVRLCSGCVAGLEARAAARADGRLPGGTGAPGGQASRRSTVRSSASPHRSPGRGATA